MDDLTQRIEAMRAARDILTSLDHGTDDLIVVAEWLLTGQYDAALAMAEQRARNYREYHADDMMSADAGGGLPLGIPRISPTGGTTGGDVLGGIK